VVQRYGQAIAGGAEYHCRLVAEHMAHHAQVEVLSTCAEDYISWANHYPEGTEEINGVRVRRFRVKRPRDPQRFASWTNRVFREEHAEKDELRWLEEEGPFSPRLVRYVSRHLEEHDFFVFFSYRYYTTYHGLSAVRQKAVLVPTAEDDGVYRLSIFPPFFRTPRAIVYNSVEEREMIHRLASNKDIPSDVVGVGSALPSSMDPGRFRKGFDISGRFILYVGRIDENKGCRQLFDYFRRYRADTGSALRLVLIGQSLLPIPADPGILHLGFLADESKWDALSAADLLVMPSKLESLSMVTNEAFWAERPVLVNGTCEVLRGQCLRSNGGLYYTSYDEFKDALSLLEAQEGLRRRLGANGRRYYEAHYSWPVVEGKYLELLARVKSPRAGP